MVFEGKHANSKTWHGMWFGSKIEFGQLEDMGIWLYRKLLKATTLTLILGGLKFHPNF